MQQDFNWNPRYKFITAFDHIKTVETVDHFKLKKDSKNKKTNKKKSKPLLNTQVIDFN